MQCWSNLCAVLNSLLQQVGVSCINESGLNAIIRQYLSEEPVGASSV